MALLTVYKLHFISPLHIGDNRSDYGISLKTVQSDAMYAALTSCLAMLNEKIPQDGNLGCTISSLFPYYQKDKSASPVYFFFFFLQQRTPKLKNIEFAKKIKKIAWLDLTYFQQLINGNVLFDNDFNFAHIKKSFLTAQNIDENFIYSQVSPRVSVSRTGNEDATPFYMDRIYFKDYSGLFFLVIGDTTLLDKAIELLQYSGIGTDRNVGNGYFTFEKSTIDLKLPKDYRSAISLSTFIPENQNQLNDMIEGDHVAYDLIRRGGWITDPGYNTFRKNIIYAFSPASIFNLAIQNVAINGKIVNLCPKEIALSHPIWRYGKSIFLPIKI